MPHVNVQQKRPDEKVEYLNTIYLTNKHDVYIELNNKTIVTVSDNGEKTIKIVNRKSSWYSMLELLIINNDEEVATDTIFQYCTENQEEYENEDAKVTNIYKELLKQDFYKKAKNDGLDIEKVQVTQFKQSGYKLTLPVQ